LDSMGMIVVVSTSLFVAEFDVAGNTGNGAAASCDDKIDLTPEADSRSKKSTCYKTVEFFIFFNNSLYASRVERCLESRHLS
jgi:hypothetical protein